MSISMSLFSITKGSTYVVAKDQMNLFARDFLAFLMERYSSQLQTKGVFVSLAGNLGAGKTTFTQQLALRLGVKDTVNSPTFVIQKKYETNDQVIKNLVHVDTYRLEQEEEVRVLGLEALHKTPHTVILLEWPEKVPVLAGGTDIKLVFEVDTENSRKISIL